MKCTTCGHSDLLHAGFAKTGTAPCAACACSNFSSSSDTPAKDLGTTQVETHERKRMLCHMNISIAGVVECLFDQDDWEGAQIKILVSSPIQVGNMVINTAGTTTQAEQFTEAVFKLLMRKAAATKGSFFAPQSTAKVTA